MKLGLFVPLTAPVATPDFALTLGRDAEATTLLPAAHRL